MTPEERQQLRDFIAQRVMGWTFLPSMDTSGFGTKWKHNFDPVNPGFLHEGGTFIPEKTWNDWQYYFKDDKRVIRKDAWAPDLPASPASQILLVIEKMRELGWDIRLSSSPGVDCVTWFCVFKEEFKGVLHHREMKGAYADNPLDAILLAARKAVEGR